MFTMYVSVYNTRPCFTAQIFGEKCGLYTVKDGIYTAQHGIHFIGKVRKTRRGKRGDGRRSELVRPPLGNDVQP